MDSSCNRRLNARTMWSFGARREALIIMSHEPEVMAAMQATGMVTAGPGDPGYRPGAVVTRNVGYRPAAIGGCSRHIGGNPTLPCVE